MMQVYRRRYWIGEGSHTDTLIQRGTNLFSPFFYRVNHVSPHTDSSFLYSHLWTKLDSVFEEHSFKLFVTNQDYESSYTSPISRERTPDAYHFIHPGDGRVHRCSYGDFVSSFVLALFRFHSPALTQLHLPSLNIE